MERERERETGERERKSDRATLPTCIPSRLVTHKKLQAIINHLVASIASLGPRPAPAGARCEGGGYV